MLMLMLVCVSVSHAVVIRRSLVLVTTTTTDVDQSNAGDHWPLIAAEHIQVASEDCRLPVYPFPLRSYFAGRTHVPKPITWPRNKMRLAEASGYGYTESGSIPTHSTRHRRQPINVTSESIHVQASNASGSHEQDRFSRRTGVPRAVTVTDVIRYARRAFDTLFVTEFRFTTKHATWFIRVLRSDRCTTGEWPAGLLSTG